MSGGEVRLYTLPDTLRRKAFVAEGSLEEALQAAVARAEAEVARLSGSFDGWMEASLAGLADAVGAYRRDPSPASRASLFRAAHELRGRAGQIGYPLAGRIAGCLARLAGSSAPLPAPLAASHADAIRAMVRERARGDGDPVAAALAAEFERLCEETLAGQPR